MTHKVGTKRVNAWGLFDMQGNVWEWCQDWYGLYLQGSVTDPIGATDGTKRVLRGNCWLGPAAETRLTGRIANAPSLRTNVIGFRLVRQ
jgi:formylglycine-generating enzyme required for sulfatase activity